ncbi:DUF1501 domain-containing protein [Kangiella sp. HZ709]|uniref:DUF1501 domain-containing protein n=1 Tax=Kangiella sp. HZ709 TaxID=2666328 RepID=UPI0012B11719|nr:DUF1501 domain-containing protein [Kangiella sp. HZ709]MRX28714.1 DUF1501 domain-containing protein [Kangiella sp. HZ709]
MSKLNRRDFFKLGAGTIASAGLMNWSQPLIAAGAPPTDYKAIVNIFFLGGNDGFNMVIPRSDFEYNEYSASRQNLAVARGDILPISPITAGGAQFGFHPAFSEMQQLFSDGKLGVMANVGNLIQPVTKGSLENPATPRPRQLFSHNDQQDQWRYGDPDTTKTGWGGRLMDYKVMDNTNALLTAMSIGGRSKWLVSDQNLDISIGSNGFDRYNYVRPDRNWTQDRRTAFRSLLDTSYSNPFTKEFSDTQKRTMELIEQVGDLTNNLADFTTQLPQDRNRLAESLRMVGRMIAIREQLGMTRQVFYVAMGGFDTHDDQNTRQPALLGQISQAMKYFYDLTVELGVENSVTSFTSSEFGRTLTSNGDGTDHAWGNHQLMMGGMVRGGDIYGTMPSLEIGGPDDYRNDGRIIPTTSVEQFSKPVLDWFDAEPAQISTILPNLNAFNANAINYML